MISKEEQKIIDRLNVVPRHRVSVRELATITVIVACLLVLAVR